MKILAWLILPLATILLAGFAIANRAGVTVSLDPFPLEFSLPLYLLIFATLLLGILTGGSVVWWRQGRWRRRARADKREVRRLNQALQSGDDGAGRELVSVRDGAETAA